MNEVFKLLFVEDNKINTQFVSEACTIFISQGILESLASLFAIFLRVILLIISTPI